MGELSLTQPVSVWNRPLKTDFRKLFVALGKTAAQGAAQNWQTGEPLTSYSALAYYSLFPSQPSTALPWKTQTVNLQCYRYFQHRRIRTFQGSLSSHKQSTQGN